MVLQWIYNTLLQKRNQERYKVIRLQWQLAQLQKNQSNRSNTAKIKR